MIKKYWPIDHDSEGEIYENLAWDLPGFRKRTRVPKVNPGRPRRDEVKVT